MSRSLNVSNRSLLPTAGTSALLASLVLSACLMAVAIGTPQVAWLGWLTLPPLLIAIRNLRPVKAAGCGLLWGSSLFLFATAVVDTRVALTWQSACLLSLAPAAYAGMGSWLTRTRVGFSPMLLAAAWIGVEYALSPLSMRFGLLAGDQARGSFLHAASGLLGYGVVSFFIAYANGLLLTALTALRWQLPTIVQTVVSGEPRGLVFDRVISCLTARVLLALMPRAPPA